MCAVKCASRVDIDPVGCPFVLGFNSDVVHPHVRSLGEHFWCNWPRQWGESVCPHDGPGPVTSNRAGPMVAVP